MLKKVKALLRGGYGEVPQEYKDYILIKELYHCKPSELENENEELMDLHFKMLMLERKEEDLKIKRQNQNGKL